MTSLGFLLAGLALGLIVAQVLDDKQLINIAAGLVLLTSVALLLAQV